MPNRRKHPRLRFDIAIDIESGHSLYSARTRDVSEGGVFVKTRAPIKVGTEIHLRLNLNGEHIAAMGEVMWQLDDSSGRRVGIGVQFTSLSPYAREVLRRALQAHIHAPEGAEYFEAAMR
ncbi:MAG: PilZ domain-containing protein [Myxococcales bacterium]|nr:PilZ domain-containing protein [Myxococcales bacterium]